MAYFEVLTHIRHEGLGENTENLNEDGRCVDRDSNLTSEYKREALPHEPTYSVFLK